MAASFGKLCPAHDLGECRGCVRGRGTISCAAGMVGFLRDVVTYKLVQTWWFSEGQRPWRPLVVASTLAQMENMQRFYEPPLW